MKRVLGIALAVSVTACATAINYTQPDGPRYVGGSAARPPSRPRLRIVTFNIAHARQIDGAIGCLSAPPLSEADVVLLQEMDVPGTKAIAGGLSSHYVYYPASARPGEPDMGNAILSPWPIEDTRKLILPHTSRLVRRGRIATVATLAIDETRVRVYSLHLSSPLGLGEGGRRDQANAVLADLRDWKGPVIVGGDFNSASVGKQFEAAGFQWLTKSLRKTCGPFAFDHVFVRDLPLAVTRTDSEVVRTCRGVSDHFPVVAHVFSGATYPIE